MDSKLGRTEYTFLLTFTQLPQATECLFIFFGFFFAKFKAESDFKDLYYMSAMYTITERSTSMQATEDDESISEDHRISRTARRSILLFDSAVF
jgi:hypothetical protein